MTKKKMMIADLNEMLDLHDVAYKRVRENIFGPAMSARESPEVLGLAITADVEASKIAAGFVLAVMGKK